MSWVRTGSLIITAHPSTAGFKVSKNDGLATVVAGPVRGLYEGHRFDGVVHGSNKRVREPASLNLYRIPCRGICPIERTIFHFIGLTFRIVHEQTHFCDDSALRPLPLNEALLMPQSEHVPVIG